MILYILLSGVPPFWGETEQQIFDAVAKGQLDFDTDPWPHVSSEAKDCVRAMLQQVQLPTLPPFVHFVFLRTSSLTMAELRLHPAC